MNFVSLNSESYGTEGLNDSKHSYDTSQVQLTMTSQAIQTMLLTLLNIVKQKEKQIFPKFDKHNKLAGVSNYTYCRLLFEKTLRGLTLLHYTCKEFGKDTSNPMEDKEATDTQILIFLHSTIHNDINKSLA